MVFVYMDFSGLCLLTVVLHLIRNVFMRFCIKHVISMRFLFDIL